MNNNIVSLFGNNTTIHTSGETQHSTELSPISNDSTLEENRIDLLDSLHTQGAFYDVKTVDNLYPVEHNGMTIYQPTGKKTLINGDTLEPISVMSEGYTVVQNKDVFAALDREIANSGLDLTGAYTKVDIANNGAQVAVRYIFPAHRIEVSNGDTTDLMITAINSFNGSTSFCIYLGGFRGYCMNTQVFGTTIVQYKKQHCAQLNINKAARIIRSGIDVFNQEGEVWQHMASAPVTTGQAYNALAELAEVDIVKYPTHNQYMREVASISARTTKLENYKRIYDKYIQEMGNNEFALYNTLTHISTHGSAKSGNKPQAISTFGERAKRVTSIATKHLASYANAA